MCRTRFKKIAATFVAVMHVLFSVLLVVPGYANAQAVDVEPPTIEHESVDQGVRGETQVFSATVADNNAISSMTLHYRFGSTTGYITVPMSPISGTSIYTASVDTANASSDLIQYYMEARDTGGNRTVQGFAFDPFERVLVDDDAAIVTDTTSANPTVVAAAPRERMSTQRKIIYGLLGVLVVGGLAAASSSGGSSGGSSEEQVDLTIFVPQFQ